MLKHVMEALRSIFYKLLMMSAPLSGCFHVYGDNVYVICNTQRPESTLRHKSNSICYHDVCESVSMVDNKTSHISTHYNDSEPLTKVLYGAKRKIFVGEMLHDIYD